MSEKKNIRMMLAISFLQGMVFYASVATLYRQAAGITVWQMSVIESLSLAATIGLEVPWGMVGDRIGYRKTMIISCMVFFVSKIVFWQAEGFAMFLLERLLLAVAVAGLSGVDESILYLSCSRDDFQRVMGRYAALGTAGLLTSSAVYTLLIRDYRQAALFTTVAYGLAAMLSLRLKEVKRLSPAQRRRPLADFRECLRLLCHTRGLLPLILSGALLGETIHQATIFLNQLQYVRCGWEEGMIGAAFTLTNVVELSGAFSARCTRRWGERRMGLGLMLLSALCCGILTVTRSGWLSLLCLLTLCACAALYGPLASEMTNRMIQTDNRATALSVAALLSDGVMMATVLLLGRAAEIRLPLALGLSCALCLAAALLFARSSGPAA